MATRHEWAQRVRRWRASGLTARAFAAREGCNAGTLSWWASALRADSPIPPRFIDVTDQLAAPSPALDLVVRDGVVIRIRQGFDAALLREVNSALESR